MDPNKNLNDLLINLKPKVIRFTGEKFPTELWNTSCKKKIRISLPKKFTYKLEKGFLGIFFKQFFETSCSKLNSNVFKFHLNTFDTSIT